MAEFNPSKLYVTFDPLLQEQELKLPRLYTLTHSDRTGDLFFKIGLSYDQERLSNWYVKFMRDEVLGEWTNPDQPSLHLHCHVSGGFVFGSARLRLSIFRHHMPMVLQAICYGDRFFLTENVKFRDAPIFVHFQARQKALNQVERWGQINNHLNRDN